MDRGMAAAASGIVLLSLLSMAVVPAFPPAPLDARERVLQCNREPSPDRMPCYKAVLADLWGRGWNVSEMARLDAYTLEPYTPPGDPGSPFGNNCHTFYHALGDLIAERVSHDPARAMALSPPTCTGGAYMAVTHRLHLVHHYSLPKLREIYLACPDVPAICAHVVGHALFDKHVSSILKDLDDISARRYGQAVPAYDYAGDLNTSAAFDECGEVVEPRNIEICYTGVAHSFFLASKHRSIDYADLLRDCDSLQGLRDDCRDNLALRWGLNEVAPLAIGNNASGAVATCGLLGPELLGRCYTGVGVGIGLWVEAQVVGPDGIRTEANRTADLLRRHLDLCRQMDPDHVSDCIRGLAGSPRFKALYFASGLVDDDVEEVLAARPVPIGG